MDETHHLEASYVKSLCIIQDQIQDLCVSNLARMNPGKASGIAIADGFRNPANEGWQ